VVAVGGGEINLAAQNFKPMRLYAVTVLRAHNSKKGRRKAADRKIYVLGRDALSVKDAVEGYGPGGRAGRVPGIKTVLEVREVGIRDLGRLGAIDIR